MLDSGSNGDGKVAPFVFDFRNEAAKREASESWRHWIEGLAALGGSPEPGGENPALASRGFVFESLLPGYSASSSSGVDHGPAETARTGTDAFLLLAIEAGAGELDAAGRTIQLEKGGMFLLDLTRPFLQPTNLLVQIIVLMPRELIEPYSRSLDLLHGLHLPGESVAHRILFAHLAALRTSIPALSLEDASRVAQATAALIGLLCDPSENANEAEQARLQGDRLQRLRRYIQANLADPELGPKSICEALPFSRASLYRIMKPYGGVQRYIRDRRLEKAFLLLTRPADQRASINAIGQACGFRTASSFTRAVKGSFGLGPRELASLSQGEGNWVTETGVSNLEDMRRWILAGRASAR